MGEVESESSPTPEPAETDEEVTALARLVSDALANNNLALANVRQTAALTPWEQLRHEDYRQDIGLKKKYADRMLLILGAELVFVNGLFLFYTWLGVHWKVPGTTMQVWLSATVVQVVGIVYVVTRYLFPPRGTSGGS
jgi:hypothetical protein